MHHYSNFMLLGCVYAYFTGKLSSVLIRQGKLAVDEYTTCCKRPIQLLALAYYSLIAMQVRGFILLNILLLLEHTDEELS